MAFSLTAHTESVVFCRSDNPEDSQSSYVFIFLILSLDVTRCNESRELLTSFLYCFTAAFSFLL